jgi:hypothetical protein
MAKRELAVKTRTPKTEPNHGVKQQDSQTINDPRHAQDLNQFALTEHSFLPRTNRHISLLSRTVSSRERASLVINLQRTYGNSYVQRLLRSLPLESRTETSYSSNVHNQGSAGVQPALTRFPAGGIVQLDKEDFEKKKKNLEKFFSEKQKQDASQKTSGSGLTGEKKNTGASGKKAPPIPTSKPWKNNLQDKKSLIKIQDLAASGANLGGSLKGSQLVDVANFAAGVKYVAGAKGKKNLMEYAGTADTVLGTGVKAAGFVVEKIKDSLKEGSTGSVVLNVIKEALGPIPDAISTAVNILKAIYSAATKKAKTPGKRYGELRNREFLRFFRQSVWY